MSIDELANVLKPPQQPQDPGNAILWNKVQKHLDTTLPRDLCDYGMAYGTGRIRGSAYEMEVFNPFAPSYQKDIESECQRLRAYKDMGLPLPYSVFPEKPGLLPWGWDDNGHSMYWLTKGKPNDWPVILKSSDDEYEQWDLPMTTFMAKVLTNEVKCILWRKPFTKSDRTFKPKAKA